MCLKLKLRWLSRRDKGVKAGREVGCEGMIMWSLC